MDEKTASALRQFVVLIAHGDEAHKKWLHEAVEAYINDRPLPPPDGKGVSI